MMVEFEREYEHPSFSALHAVRYLRSIEEATSCYIASVDGEIWVEHQGDLRSRIVDSVDHLLQYSSEAFPFRSDLLIYFTNNPTYPVFDREEIPIGEASINVKLHWTRELVRVKVSAPRDEPKFRRAFGLFEEQMDALIPSVVTEAAYARDHPGPKKPQPPELETRSMNEVKRRFEGKWISATDMLSYFSIVEAESEMVRTRTAGEIFHAGQRASFEDMPSFFATLQESQSREWIVRAFFNTSNSGGTPLFVISLDQGYDGIEFSGMTVTHPAMLDLALSVFRQKSAEWLHPVGVDHPEEARDPLTIYRFFISSTKKDFEAERRSAYQTVLDTRFMAAGMEDFPAGPAKWETIKREIDLSDYVILLIGQWYGSIDGNSGKSYTEMEFDYAVETGVVVLPFRLVDPPLSNVQREHETEMSAFISAVERDHNVVRFTNAEDLSHKLKDTIVQVVRSSTRPGWVRGKSKTREPR